MHVMVKSANQEPKSNSKRCILSTSQMERRWNRHFSFPIAIFTVWSETFANSGYCSPLQSIICELCATGHRVCGQQSALVLFAKCCTLTNSWTFFPAKVSNNSIGKIFVALITPTPRPQTTWIANSSENLDRVHYSKQEITATKTGC